jgi:DNA polymerase elongation subunit (family B)
MFYFTNVECGYKELSVSYIKNGKRDLKNANFQPKLYIKNPNGKFRSIYGEPLEERKFANISEYKKFIKEYKDTNLEIYGNINPQYQFIREFFKDTKDFDLNATNVAYFDIEVSSLTKEDRFYGFPEAHIAPIPIVSIAVYSSLHKKMLVLGFKDYNPDKELFPDMDIEYIKCRDEETLLETFCLYLTNPTTRPDILYGWNSNAFDIPYIHNRMKIIGGEKFVNKLSPVGNVYAVNAMKRVFGQNQGYLKYNITGIPHLDMMDVYRKFSGRMGAYSGALNSVAKYDLNQQKLDYGVSRSIMDMYFDDFQRYISYNIQDTYLLKLIDDKRGLSEKVLGTAIENKCLLNDTLGTTRQWETILYNAYADRGLIIPPKVEHQKMEYAGGYVRDSITGVKKWNMTLDFNSLYPNIMVGMNMSPETILQEYEEGCVTSPNGVYFSGKEQGVLSSEVWRMFNKRKHYQKLSKEERDKGNIELSKKYDVIQYLLKINLNSSYGGCSNPYFLFFKPEIASTITAMGQHAIKAVAERLNHAMNKLCGTIGDTYFEYDLTDFSNMTDEEMTDFIVMGDTDSCAISFEPYVNKFLKGKSDEEILNHILEIHKNILTPELDECLNNIQTEFNFYKHTLKLSLETITKKSIFLQKKRYLGHVVWDDGVICLDEKEPHFKIKGVEGIKSSTSEYFQEKFMEFYRLCLLSTNNDDIRNYIKDVEDDYKKKYVMECGKPVKIKNLEKYKCDKKIYKSGTPEATKGALIYNHYLKRFGLDKKYDLLREDDYASLLKLSPNNGFTNINKQGYKYSETVVCLPSDGMLPPELKLENHVDYDQQFSKFFKNPCLEIMKIMKISPIKFKTQ